MKKVFLLRGIQMSLRIRLHEKHPQGSDSFYWNQPIQSWGKSSEVQQFLFFSEKGHLCDFNCIEQPNYDLNFTGSGKHYREEGRHSQAISRRGKKLVIWRKVALTIISEWSEDQHQRRELPRENRDGDREHRIHLQGIHAHLQQVRRGLLCCFH